MNKKKSLTAIGPRKAPKQERSRQTFQVILNGAATIIRRDGIKKLSTNRVADESGVSIGSLYQYFPSKAAILAALIDQVLQREFKQIQQIFESLSPAAGPREIARTFFAQYFRLEGEDLQERKELMEVVENVEKYSKTLEFHQDVVGLVLNYFGTHFNVSSATSSLNAFIVKYLLKGISLASVDDQVSALPRSELVAEYAELLLNLLKIPDGERGPRA